MTDRGRVHDDRIEGVFYELVTTALAEHSVNTSPDTEFYLVRLLGAFASQAPSTLSDALGVELLRAASLEPEQRYVRLKTLADSTLFLTGMFIDHIEARAAATDYYFAVGKRAYLDLHSLDEIYDRNSNVRFSETYRDLGTRFEDYARVLTTIADRDVFPVRERIHRLYERWLATGSRRDEARLLTAGVSVVRGDARKNH